MGNEYRGVPTQLPPALIHPLAAACNHQAKVIMRYLEPHVLTNVPCYIRNQASLSIDATDGSRHIVYIIGPQNMVTFLTY